MSREDLCPTCVRPATDPYRSHDRSGKIVQGCIDDFHTGHLVQISESNRWHNSTAAKKLRASHKKRLRELTKRR